MGFLDAIQKDRGQPASVRVGIVTSVNPLVVSVQGTEFTDVGALNGVTPTPGATVALLGQSSVSADGSSWLLLGEIGGSGGGGGEQGLRFASFRNVLYWNAVGEVDVPTFTFTADLAAGRLYQLKATFATFDDTGGSKYPYMRMYIDGNMVWDGWSQDHPLQENVWNDIEAWVRPAADITGGIIKLTAEQILAPVNMGVNALANGIFALFDYGVQDGIVDV